MADTGKGADMVDRTAERRRFWAKVDRRGPDECWPWQGHLGGGGYGLFNVYRDDGRRTTMQAHRFAYLELKGDIPPGLVLDHVCHNRDVECPAGECSHRLCVNPDHLEPVTDQVNILRGKTPAAREAAQKMCKRGHPLSGSNVRMQGRRRVCRTCQAERRRRHYERTGN